MPTASSSPASSEHQRRMVYEVKENALELEHHLQGNSDVISSSKDAREFLKQFQRGFQLNVLDRPNDEELVLELIGVDVSFANAVRRILIAEVPTMAIERVYIMDNTSIIHDEVLAHRLGLVPIKVDARMFEEYPEDDEDDQEKEEAERRRQRGQQQQGGAAAAAGDDDDDVMQNDKATDRNTIVFRLSVSCEKSEARAHAAQQRATYRANSGRRRDDNDDDDDDEDPINIMDDAVIGGTQDDVMEAAKREAMALRNRAIDTPGRPYTKHIYSGDIEWVPHGNQSQIFGDNGIRPIHDDILLVKLRPGQAIELEAHAQKGVGKDHAKYSPVATASYRLMPHVEMLEDVYDDDAKDLVHLYEPGVFDLVPSNKPGTTVKARVINPYACTMSRNFMRNPVLQKAIRMTRIPNHFIFQIESVGMLPPAVLFSEALQVLQGKCQRLVDLTSEQSLEQEENRFGMPLDPNNRVGEGDDADADDDQAE